MQLHCALEAQAPLFTATTRPSGRNPGSFFPNPRGQAAERRTFVCAVDISPFQRKTTQMQFAGHVVRRGGMEPGFSAQRIRLEQLPQLCSKKEKNGRKRTHETPNLISRGHPNACEPHLQLAAMLWTIRFVSQSSRHL